MKKRLLFIIIILLVIFIMSLLIFEKLNVKDSKIIPKEYNENDFNLKFIKTTNSSQNDNYLISPYSLEIALSMLKMGASNNTYDEIDRLVKTRVYSSLSDKVKLSNAIFINEKYKDDIKISYTKKLSSKYLADVIYDDFKTVYNINNLVNKKTDGLIKTIKEDIDSSDVLIEMNAVAIDVKWKNYFECINTSGYSFYGLKDKVEMMSNSDDAGNYSYFETRNSKGIIMDYEDSSNLEFVGILPNDSINNFIENLTIDELNQIDENKKESNESLTINVKIPRFSYEFTLDNLISILNSMGINDMFTSDANFTNISESINLYVNEILQKSYIELNEEGTKAAAITYSSFDIASAYNPDTKEIDIVFDKPFIYMIRDKRNHEILFFGVVKTPNKWTKTTCNN